VSVSMPLNAVTLGYLAVGALVGLLIGLLVRLASESAKVSLGKSALGGAICGLFAPSLMGFGKYIYSCLTSGMDLEKAAFVPWPIVLLPLGAGLGAASGLLAAVFGGPTGEDESRGDRTKRSVGMGAKMGAKFGFIGGFALFIGLFVYRFVTSW
jgi:hypothetical protein